MPHDTCKYDKVFNDSVPNGEMSSKE